MRRMPHIAMTMMNLGGNANKEVPFVPFLSLCILMISL